MARQADLRAIFDRAMDAKGGVANLADIPEPARKLVHDALVVFRRVIASTANAASPIYVAHTVHVDLVANPTINAVAFEAHGHEFIGVHTGSLLFLYDAFLSLFSSPSFMPEIGAAKAERTTNIDLTAWLQRENVAHIFELAPVDPARVTAAQFLTINAYNFLLAHEVGHITKGHLKYLAEAHGIVEYAAHAHAESPSTVGTPLRHMLEIGADENAAHGSLHMFRPEATGAVLPNAGGVLRDYRTWATSIGVIFALFDRHFALHGPSLSTSHPALDVRYLNVLWSGWEKVRELSVGEFGSCVSQTLGATIEMGSFFEQIGIGGRPFSFLVPGGSSVREEVVDQVWALREGLVELERAGMEQLASCRDSALRASRMVRA